MRLRADAEVLGIATLLLVCGAFVVSFVIGLGDRSRSVATPVSAADAAVAGRPATGRIEVLNASGRSGLARAATGRLRDGGFDVVHFGNAAGFSGDSSIVITRTADDTVARAVARHLGIELVQAGPDTSLLVDATVILGRDWSANGTADADTETWRARLRRWVRPGS
jgi:hypothetical protein